MSLRMVSLWLVGALLVAAPLKADPPQGEPAEIANQVKDEPVIPKPVPVASTDRRNVLFDVKVWDVDHAALRAITKTDMGMHEFYKAHGLIKQPDWISAAIGDAIGDLLAPPGRKGVAPAPLPVRAFAVRKSSVSKTLLGHDISSAFKTIAEPSLVATNGREATMLSGGEVPIVVPQSGGSTEIVYLEFGLKLKILPRLIDKGRITLGLDFEHSELDRKSEAGESGIRLISSQGFRLSAQMKLGEQLLVAQQIGKQDVTRLVQIQPTLVTEQSVADKPNASSTGELDRNSVEQFAGQLDAPSSNKPVEPVVKSATREVGRRIAPVIKGKKYELTRNHGPWMIMVASLAVPPPGSREEGTEPEQAANDLVDELRKNGIPAYAFEQQQEVESFSTIDHSGKKLKQEIRTSDDRICVLAGNYSSAEDSIAQKTLKFLKTYKPQSNHAAFRATPGRPGPLSGAFLMINPLLLPDEIAAAPATPKELEITVEDRWPIGDIKVGQRVVAIPVTIEKTSLQADTTAFVFNFDSKFSQRVTRIEPLPNRTGRRVTVSVPFNEFPEANEFVKAAIESYLDGARSASSTFVIPAAKFSQTDFMSGRPIQDIYGHIPVELRPRPVELTVGETFMAYGVSALMGSATEEKHHEIGALNFDWLDKYVWRATAAKIGMTQLIQLPFAQDMIGPARVTEYLVKADTRELELHIRQQFPSAKVTITSIGAAAIMLKGTVSSDEDATGIIELAEQFSPKVLNRLKVGTREQEVGDRRMGTPARPLELVAADDSEATGDPLKADRVPERITPAAIEALKKSEQLEQLREEIRALRQDVRELIQRLDREQPAIPKHSVDAKPANAEAHRQLIADSVSKLLKRACEASGVPVAGKVSAEKKRICFIGVTNGTDDEVGELKEKISEQIDAMIGGSQTYQPISRRYVEASLKQLRLRSDELLIKENQRAFQAVMEEMGQPFDELLVAKLASGVTPPSRKNQSDYLLTLEMINTHNNAYQKESFTLRNARLVSEFNNFIRDFNELMEHQRFAEAEVIAKQAVELDPNNPLSRTMTFKAAVARRVADHEKQRPTTTTPAKTSPNLSEEEQRVMRQLGKSVIVEMKEPTPLRDAIKQLARLGDINVVLDQAGLEEVDVVDTTPVALQVRGVRLSTALHLLLEPLYLDFVVKHDVLQITNRQRAAGPLTIVAYPVPDLLNKDGDLSNLGDLLTSMIEPDSWELVGGPATVRGNVATQSLVVRQSQANHVRVRELLETLRKAGNQTTSATPRQKSATSATTQDARASDGWQALVARRKGKDAGNEVDQQLATKVSVYFEKAPLSKVIEHLSEAVKIRIVLDHDGLKDESLTAQTPVSLAVDQIQLRSALALLLEPLNLDFIPEADGLKVSSVQRIHKASIVMTYSVADLVCPIEGLEIQLTKNGATTPQRKRIPDDVATISLDELVKLIRSTVAPTSWSEVGGEGQIKAHPDTFSLVIRQSRAVHDELCDLLEQLRRLHDLQVSFELRVLKFDAGFPGVSSALPEGWNAASAKKPLLLSAEQSAVLLKAANSSDHRNCLWQTPKITLLNGQRVLLSTDSDSPINPLRVTATHAISADRESVRMSLAADAGSSSWSTTANVPNGQSLLINVTDTSTDGTQTGIPIRSKKPNADRLFKNVTKSMLKPGESRFLLATPHAIVVEEVEISARAEDAGKIELKDTDAKRRSMSANAKEPARIGKSPEVEVPSEF